MKRHNSNIASIATKSHSLPTINPTLEPDQVFDSSSTIRTIKAVRSEYNQNRAKGKPKFNGNVMETACIILSLSLKHELPKLRNLFPNAYQSLISDTRQSLFVWTNRQQIATMKDDRTALSTISRHINILMDAGVLVAKHNAQVQSIEEQKANLPKVIDLRGRGNFRLWINSL